MRTLPVVFCLLLMAGCGSESATEPQSLDTQLILALGETSTIFTSGVSLTFNEVVSDSRCPINALCIVAGSATVRVRIQGRGIGIQNRDLQTPSGQPLQLGDLTFELVTLQPHPFAGHPTDPTEYRATIRVRR